MNTMVLGQDFADDTTVTMTASGRDYAEHGYVVCREVVPAGMVDRMLEVYQRDIVHSGDRFYRQNTNLYEKNVLTKNGYVANCFLDVHAYSRYDDLRRSVLDVVFSAGMLGALSGLTGASKHNVMQTMLFDANTETPPHQDWWYLDSVPNGHLLAAWIALEDIHEDAGRFYVFPGSQHVNLHETGGAPISHSEWLKLVRKYMDDHREELHAPALCKGDVLFWNSRTIHGALPTRDEARSRKSLTAHYLPTTHAFGNLFTRKDWISYQDYNGHQYFANQPEYSLKAMLASKVKQAVYDHPALLNLARKVQRRSIADL